MEEIKKIIGDWSENKSRFFETPWFKSLVAFIIFLAIFCFGVSFGERHQNFGNFQKMGCQMNKMENKLDEHGARGNFNNPSMQQSKNQDESKINQNGNMTINGKDQTSGTATQKQVPATFDKQPEQDSKTTN